MKQIQFSYKSALQKAVVYLSSIESNCYEWAQVGNRQRVQMQFKIL